ncbi:MAG TPA: tripartite tricarboxylate transporter substrate-binding protein [Candidatus Binatia bacterium]|jgi:tripartite-type tricarboxylate transporter receptor subunit TctC|nr:tripartite tricarboxylate transporter substrate-binding protein [Candidatus Binatia bacterium]
MLRGSFLLSLILGTLLLATARAPAQDFYKDKIIRFIVGQAAGGGYDTYTRMIARHMLKHIPGHPAVTVENMTGAGSLVAANYLYNTAKPDGLTVANWNSAFVLSQALGDPNVRFDARKFGWIGAPSKGVPVCLIMGFAGPKTFDEILKSGKPIKMGGTAPGSHSIDLPLMLNKMLGTKFQVVSGYPGTSQTRLALQRREVDGQCTNWESVVATQKELLDAGGDDKMIPFLIHTRLGDPELKNLPLFTEVLKDEVNVATYRAYMSQMEYQRPLTVSPGTPKDRLEILRRAFKATLSDPEFRAQVDQAKLDITYVSGEEIDRIVAEVLSVSPKVKENLQFLTQAK